MKKKPRSLIRKFVLYLFAALFFITTIIFLVFGVKGYFMYREAVKAYPISQMVSSIQNRENFVEYDELPTIYIDAVISAEDKRFESHCGVDLIAISRAVVNDIKAKWNALKLISLLAASMTATKYRHYLKPPKER